MKYIVFIIFLLYGATVWGQADSTSKIKSRLVLIGNSRTGKDGTAAVLRAVHNTLPLDENTRILFLGDNTREPVGGSAAKGSVGYIAGDKEWNSGERGGLDSVLEVQKTLQALYSDKDILLPKGGCPGPEEVKLGGGAVLVLLNTQWWLHEYEKPGIESDCDTRSDVQVYEALDGVLRDNADKLMIVAGHHPLRSKGIKGDHFSLKQHLFPLTDLNPSLYVPLPVVGSLYPILRNAFPSRQELKHPVYQAMINGLEKVLSTHPHTLYVSAHEQNLQLLQKDGLFYLISGAAGKTRRASWGKGTLFASRRTGFAVVEIREDKKASVVFYTLHGDSARVAWRRPLIDFSQKPPLPDTTTVRTVTTAADSVAVPASTTYANPSKLRALLLGRNYRDIWATPVKLPVFDLQHELGGLTISKTGGGKQTKTLHLKDSSGRTYKLRTIDKDPKEFLPPAFRSTLTQAIVNDVISAAHPYAPLVVSELATRVGVVEPKPRYFFVPNDTAFGYYRPWFGNKVAMLVDKDPAPFDDTKGSYDVLNKITEKSDHRVDQRAVLRARLLDFLIGDFDRHLGQWSWGESDTGKGKLYEPVPKDRDQAFFLSDGLIVQLVARSSLPLFKGFHYRIDNIKGLGFSAEEFDRTFLTGLDQQDWQEVIGAFQRALPDTAIDHSVRRLPPEVYAKDGAEIAAKLKSRRDDLMKEGLKYYRFLSDNVNVLGSNERDYFRVSQQGGELQVQVWERKEGDTVMQTYSRRFDPRLTREVRLYGLNGDDYIRVDSSVSKGIRIRIVGGGGKDTFEVQGPAHCYVYDEEGAGNVLYRGRNTHDKTSEAPDVNDYALNSYAYRSKGGFPKFSVAANSEYGPMIGVGWNKTTYKFRREPFATSNTLMVSYAPWRSSYKVRYLGEFNNLSNLAGLTADAVVHDEAVMNFFGLGNDTKRDNGKGTPYYRIRYSYAAADLLLTHNRFGRLNLAVGPSLYHYWNHSHENGGKVIEEPAGIGLDSAAVYSRKTYLGGKARLAVNTLPSLQAPSQGMLWQNEVTYLQQLTSTRHYLALRSDLVLAAPLADTAGLVALIKLGGGHIFNRQFEYFQAMGFGRDNNLRGFWNNRFLGRTAVYGSLELRQKLLQVRSFIVPGSLGVLGFGDIGRVWMPDVHSQSWHSAIGGGLYFFPFNRLLLSASAGYNEDGMIYNFSIGSSINWHH